MSWIQENLKRLSERRSLTSQQARACIEEMVGEGSSDALIAAFLTALRLKGETTEELLGCAQALRSMCRAVETEPRAVLDTCGTGGDGSCSLNISTLAALVAAAAGVPVAKHGNRSVTSRCGSADLIEALGMPLLMEPEQVLTHLDRHRFAFLFAPHFHPATAKVAAVRRQLGIRTIFNLLGPLVNPARARYQVIGVFAPEWCRPVAEVAGQLGVRNCLVVHGEGGWDELTPWGPSRLAWWRDGEIHESILDPQAIGLSRCSDEQLQGGGPQENAEESRRVLRGEERPASQVVSLNAAAGLMVAGQADDWRDAFQRARTTLASGQAWELVEALKASV